MPSNEKIAIAAHLHVLLRRKTGRVTDTEWMASNHEYAAEIARFAREKSVEDNHPDLAVWADKLEEIMAVPDPKPRVPLVQMVSEAVKERTRPREAPPPQPADRQSARSIDTEEEVYPESGFIESTFGAIFGDRRVAPRTQAPRPERAALREKLALSPLSRLTACSFRGATPAARQSRFCGVLASRCRVFQITLPAWFAAQPH
jgi:hypothetical protein